MFQPDRQIIHMRDTSKDVEFFLISPELGVRCADMLQGALPLLDAKPALVPSHLASLTGPDGKVFAYMVSRELWNEVKWDLRSGEKELFLKNGGTEHQSLDEFQDFMDHWDFSYEYDPAVSCPVCGNSTEDWRVDPLRPFVLTNANIGGLLVFQCRRCAATIRQKHFKDKVVHEFTPSQHPKKTGA